MFRFTLQTTKRKRTCLAHDLEIRTVCYEICECNIHSFSPAAHDICQDETEDHSYDKGNDDGDDVIGEEVSFRWRIWRVELSSPLKDA